MTKIHVLRSLSALIGPKSGLFAIKTAIATAVLMLVAVLFVAVGSAGNAIAQVVPQPANPPLWRGGWYGPEWYQFNDAVISTGATRLHDIGIRGQGFTTAVINGGFNIGHEIYGGGYIGNGGRIVNSGWMVNPGDDGNHGDHVAGIVLSMVPDSHLWLNTFWDDVAAFNDLYNDVAKRNKFNIVAVNNSWGDILEGQFATPEDVAEARPYTNEAVQRLLAGGIAVVAASGNGSVNDFLSNPNGLPGVLAVGALNQYGYIAAFSSQHRKDGLFLVAPGVNIYSTVGDRRGEKGNFYEAWPGTSMASPHVTGAITLLNSGARNASADEIIASLYNSADRIVYDGSAIVKKRYVPEAARWHPNLVWNYLNELTPDTVEAEAYIDSIKKWLREDLAPRFDETDNITADEWRHLGHIRDKVLTVMALVDEDAGELPLASEFVRVFEKAGGLAPLHYTTYGFLRVDEAYMDLTANRTNFVAGRIGSVDSGLSGILRAYAGELRADINQDTSDVFQRLDVDNTAVQTAIARQMSPRFTNATVESAHLGIVGLHRSMARRGELNRLSHAANCGCPNCLANIPDESAWATGFGTGFNKSGTLSNAAYNGHFAGTAFGFERKRGIGTLGFFGSYANHRTSGDGTAQGDWVNFGVYGRADGRTGFFEGSLSYGFGDYKMNRHVYLPGVTFNAFPENITLCAMHRTASATTHAHDLSFRLASGRDLWWINGWQIGPRSEFALSYLTFKGYSETGAQSLNLTVDNYRTTYLEGGLGLFAGKHFHVGGKRFIATGKVMGMYGGMTGNDLSGHFLTYGSHYQVRAGHMRTTWVVPEATLAWNVRPGVVISGGYAGRFGEKYSENSGSVTLGLYW